MHRTSEGVPNRYEERMCFWDKNPCSAPSPAALESGLPMALDVDQMLRFGGANALVGNGDGTMVKDNNFYFDPAFDGEGDAGGVVGDLQNWCMERHAPASAELEEHGP